MCDASRAGVKGCQIGDISLTGTDKTFGSARGSCYCQASSAASNQSASQESPCGPAHHPKEQIQSADRHAYFAEATSRGGG